MLLLSALGSIKLAENICYGLFHLILTATLPRRILWSFPIYRWGNWGWEEVSSGLAQGHTGSKWLSHPGPVLVASIHSSTVFFADPLLKFTLQGIFLYYYCYYYYSQKTIEGAELGTASKWEDQGSNSGLVPSPLCSVFYNLQFLLLPFLIWLITQMTVESLRPGGRYRK